MPRGRQARGRGEELRDLHGVRRSEASFSQAPEVPVLMAIRELSLGCSVRVLPEKALREHAEACGPTEAHGGVLDPMWTSNPCRQERVRLKPDLATVHPPAPHQALLAITDSSVRGLLTQWYPLHNIKILVAGNLRITENSFYRSLSTCVVQF